MTDKPQRRVEDTEVGQVTVPTPGDVIEAVCLAQKKWLDYGPGHVLRLVVTMTHLAPGSRCHIVTNSDGPSYFHDFLLNRNDGTWLLYGRGTAAPNFFITIIDHLSSYELTRPEPDIDVDDEDD